MLITKFNKIIRSKILWGAFAVIICISFTAYIGPSSSRRRAGGRPEGAEGTLFGKPIPVEDFRQARFFEMGLRDRGSLTPEANQKLRHRTWRRLATRQSASEMGITVADDELKEILRRDPSFAVNGAFSMERYRTLIQSQLNLPLSVFETYLREDVQIQKLHRLFESLVWISPFELSRRLSDFTDTFTVQQVTIDEADSARGATLSDSDVEAYFNRNPTNFCLPEKRSVKYVRFPITNYLAEVTVGEESVLDYYNEHLDEFATVGTNKTTEHIPVEKVRDKIAGMLRAREAAMKAKDVATDLVMCLTPDSNGAAQSLEQAAAARHLVIHTTQLFTAYATVPGIGRDPVFVETAFSLDPSDPERSFSDAVVGKDYVYVLAAKDRVESKVPEFKEVRDLVRPAALSNAVHEAFLKHAGEVRSAVQKSIAAGKTFKQALEPFGLNASTSMIFSVYGSASNTMPHADVLIPNLMSRSQGELSDPLDIPGGILLAWILQRKAGDAVSAELLRPELVKSVSRYRGTLVFADWGDYLLAKGELKDHGVALPEEGEAPEPPPESPAKSHAADLL